MSERARERNQGRAISWSPRGCQRGCWSSNAAAVGSGRGRIAAGAKNNSFWNLTLEPIEDADAGIHGQRGVPMPPHAAEDGDVPPQPCDILCKQKKLYFVQIFKSDEW